MNAVDFCLYLVTDRKQVKGQDLVWAVRQALEGGVRAVQLREKDLTDRQIFELGSALRALTAEHGARLFINDRADMAAAVDADGVHLAQSGYSPREARRIVGPGRTVGASTHSLEEACAAENDGADFITLGPVFATPSKKEYGPPLGLPLLREVTATVGIPVFAIGGVRKENVSDLMEAGAHGIALISGILAAPDITRQAREFTTLTADIRANGGAVTLKAHSTLHRKEPS